MLIEYGCKIFKHVYRDGRSGGGTAKATVFGVLFVNDDMMLKAREFNGHDTLHIPSEFMGL